MFDMLYDQDSRLGLRLNYSLISKDVYIQIKQKVVELQMINIAIRLFAFT